MIPSLVATEIRSALVEYLASTFALADDEVRDALSEFLQDQSEGIFRGPYLKVRTPFRSVDPATWTSPIDSLPDGFVPYEHQAKSFERLSTADGRRPSPTLVTTGTGSGKTECFLLPLLDHCARMRAAGQDGIKAIILYPMNALASDQAGRIAEAIANNPMLGGVTAGLYVGEAGRHADMGPDHLIDKREVLRVDPPDILLTNYKMLDFLLLRQEDRDLWTVNEPDTLQYVVLDEFHTYDGAQGTDVAMLLRRLGATLRMATDEAPLGSATPVATSATLGSGAGALAELRGFANKVFGAEFDEQSVIGETRQTIQEACGDPDYLLPIPDAATVAHLEDLDDVAAHFCIDPEAEEPAAIDSPVALGDQLLRHPLTQAVLASVGDQSRSWSDAVAEIVSRAPNWGRALMTGAGDEVELALAQFLRLLSIARREQNGRERPLFSIEVQLWVREVSRLLRTVSGEPSFRWRDSAAGTEEDDQPREPGDELPAVYCRRCGMSGWMALGSEINDSYSVNPNSIAKAALHRSPLIRTLMRSHPDDGQCRWYSPSARQLVEPASTEEGQDHPDDRVPVLVSDSEEDARAQRCPGCGERDSVRFLGLAVASLASVSINTLFASNHLVESERKLLAFTDSVQDASHRAGFFGGRTHRINLRAIMARVIRANGEVTLADLGDLLLAEAETDRDRFGLVPPDLIQDTVMRTIWADGPTSPEALPLLTQRMGFEADLEFGLRARVGRTLELSRVAAAEVRLPEAIEVEGIIAEELQRLTGTPAEPAKISRYLQGLLERMRLRGSLNHQLLAPFLDSGGKQWFLWGGRPHGLPPFTPDQGRPSFFTTATKGDLDSVTAPPGPNPSWVVDWATRTLGISPPHAGALNAFALQLLAKTTDTVIANKANGNTIYGVDRRHVHIVDVAHADTPEDGNDPQLSQVRCQICGHTHVAPPNSVERWIGTPCLRYRCVGRFEASQPRGPQYYRNLYRSGITRRVVTGEHTGLLGRAAREDLERDFKEGTKPHAPNVLTATPTLEMGIDIGDLSAVMLTSVPRNPASYIQRVGRAGRATGNSLVTTFVKTDTHGLYYLAEPEAMLAGDVRPPNCYLDAIETLERQYIAYLFDRAADQTIDAPVLPRQISQLLKDDLDSDGLLAELLKASTESSTHVESFLSLFGSQLAPTTVERLRAFAAEGIADTAQAAIAQWKLQEKELSDRRGRLANSIDRLEAKPAPTRDEEELKSLRGQRAAVVRLLRDHRNEYTISALERLGLLPNYSLVDDSVTLTATLWSRDDNDDFQTRVIDYKRSGRLAIREFAPGNSFYAGGHRHTVDALEIGSAQEPLYEQWRLCPACGYGEIEKLQSLPAVCPRCASAAIADTGASHKLLRLRASMASGSEENARVFDERDDRRRQQYEMMTAIDVEPGVQNAWQLAERAFGAELAPRTHLRTVNLGMSERTGERMEIAGAERHVTRFTVCAHCGAVAEARDDNNGTKPERLHEGWCKVRSGNVKEQWDPILLFHELTTEAIRMLLPVSMFEVGERLASFKGALLLGLREDFGGDPDHLRVEVTDMPNPNGQGRLRFLILFDSVPGGTGYLGRIADSDRMRSILESGRSVIARCPCTTEGRSACHRCLLGVVDRNEYDLVRRDLALDILDDLLEAWAPEAIESVGKIDIGKVEESELERRFKVALRDWANRTPSENVSFQTVPGRDRFAAFELRLEHEGVRTRYRIDEQEGLSTTPSTIPDYVIRRMDGPGRDIAIYLDGYQFHASPSNNNIADDASKRRGVRDGGLLVWNLVWEDVLAFHTAVLRDPPATPAPTTLLKGQARSVAKKANHDKGNLVDVDVINQNPMMLLLDYLARPDESDWRNVALSAVAGMCAATDATPVSGDDLMASMSHAVTGKAITASTGEPVVQAFYSITSDDLPLSCFLDVRDGRANEERWTVVAALDDSLVGDDGAHQRRWRDWLHWANVLQFIDGPGRDVIIVATSESDVYPLDDVFLVDVESGDSDATEDVESHPVSEDMEEELELFLDEQVRDFARTALERGAPDVTSGLDVGQRQFEAGWREAKVGVVPEGDEGFTGDGWDVRPLDEWTIEELVNVLKARS